MKIRYVFIIIFVLVSVGLFLPVDVGDGIRNPEGATDLASKELKNDSLIISGSKQKDSELINAMSAPGVYIEEIPVYAPIEGVETAVAGFMGETERGPLSPQFITSFSQYESLFGGYSTNSYLPYTVKGFFDNGGRKLYIARIASSQAQVAKRLLTDGTQELACLEALSPGEWGNRVMVKVSSGVHSTANDPTFKLEVMYYGNLSTDTSSRKIKPKPKVSEVFDDVSLSETSIYSYSKTINGSSKLVKVIVKATGGKLVPVNDRAAGFLASGTDGSSLQLSDYLGTPEQNGQPARGLYALGQIDEVTILYAPNAESVSGLNQAMIDQCETLRDRLVIMDTAVGDTCPEPTNDYESSYAAVYSPWLQIPDPVNTSINKLIPPGGFIAGTYAQTDLTRGVFKAPANLAIQGVNGLERAITRNEQSDYIFNKVNPIINQTGRGIIASGARTLTNDPEYQYVNVRRYVNHIKESISEGLEWAVFETFDATLQNRIKMTLDNFLFEEWEKGALMGSKPDEAYFTSVYSMPDDDTRPAIYIEVGLSLIRPAEFFIIKDKIN